MTLEEAKDRLDAARNLAGIIRKEVQALRAIVFELGGDPDAPKVDLTGRNSQFYIKWKCGMKFSEIARKFNLSTTTISSVCHRIDKSLESSKHPLYKRYKGLLRYKNGIKKRSQSE